MKICHLLWSFTIGGIENMLVDIVNEQCKTEEVILVVINDVVDEELLVKIDSRVKQYYCKRRKGSHNPWALVKMNFYIWKFKPDVVHCHMDKLGSVLKVPVKAVRTLHSTMCSNVDWKKFTSLFCISEAVKADAMSKGYSNGIVIYNGIMTDKIQAKYLNSSTHSDVVRFIVVGRFLRIKGQQLVIEAINLLVNRRCYNKFTVDFIGEGETMEMLCEYIKKHSINQYVNFLGRKSRECFYPRLCEYDCYIQPSISEGFGLTIAEAMCAKLPVIISDLKGPMEVIGGGKFGSYFRTGDVEDLANKMAEFLDKGQDEVLVNKAYEFARENFNVSCTAKQYINEYKKIL